MEHLQAGGKNCSKVGVSAIHKGKTKPSLSAARLPQFLKALGVLHRDKNVSDTPSASLVHS